MLISILVGAALLLVNAPAVSAQEDCVGSEECYDLPEEIETSETGNVPPWDGFTDGRLNPDMGEYYSVWCAYDRVEVWRAVPQPEAVNYILVVEIIELQIGGALDVGHFMSVVRNTEDTVTIYGSNGNGAPEPGEKAFSLQECISRNGGAPQAEDTASEVLNEPPYVPPPPPMPSVGGACSIGEFFVVEGIVLPDGTCYVSPTEFLFQWIFFLAGGPLCGTVFLVPSGLSLMALRIRQRFRRHR
jgi:hypothetical protein